MYARITSYNDWTVYLPDGTQIVQTPDSVQRLKDTNNNKIKIFTDSNGTHFLDEQTGRELRLKYNTAGDTLQLWYNTVGGVAQHIDIVFGTTTVQGKTYTYNGAGHCTPAEVLWAPLQVVREIVFPQTEPGQPPRKFTFSYNSDTTTTATDTVIFACPGSPVNYTRTVSHGLGEISRIVMPSGSEVDYTYSNDGIHDFQGFGLSSHLAEETITQKTLTHDGTVDTWSYFVPGGATVVNPDGSSFTQWGYCTSEPGCVNNKSGLIYRTIQPFTTTEKHWTNLIFSGANTSTADGWIVFNR